MDAIDRLNMLSINIFLLLWIHKDHHLRIYKISKIILIISINFSEENHALYH